MITCTNREVYRPGERVSILVNKPPDLYVGTMGRIISRWAGKMFAVKLSNGELYRWLDDQQLLPIHTGQHILRVGDWAVVTSSRMDPALVGEVIRIIKIVETDYYTVEIEGELHPRWFTGLEISRVF